MLVRQATPKVGRAHFQAIHRQPKLGTQPLPLPLALPLPLPIYFLDITSKKAKIWIQKKYVSLRSRWSRSLRHEVCVILLPQGPCMLYFIPNVTMDPHHSVYSFGPLGTIIPHIILCMFSFFILNRTYHHIVDRC